MRLPTVTPRAYRRLAMATLVMLVLIIVSGAVVRLSNSGLGCDTWPRCNTLHAISLSSNHQRIEQINRLFSGLILVPIALSLIGAFRLVPRDARLLRYCWALLVLYLGEAVLGGIAVRVQLAWFSVTSHFLLALALLAIALLNYNRARLIEGSPIVAAGQPRLASSLRAMARAVWFGIVLAIVLGTLVTASGPHGGDAKAKRLTWPLADIARIHGATVDVVLLLVVLLAWRLRRAHAPKIAMRGVSLLLLAMCVQATIGYVQWFRQIPPVLVGFHVAGATLVFLAATELQLVVAP
jgi:cytochrome c oxidase assembly protein subunit 15